VCDWLKLCHTERQEFEALWGLRRGISPDLEHEANHLKTGQSAFQKKGDVTVQVWTDKKTCVTNTYNPRHNSSEHRKVRQKNWPGNKETFLSYYWVQKKTVKWSNVFAKRALFSALLCMKH
jgi:hypothetical protein